MPPVIAAIIVVVLLSGCGDPAQRLLGDSRGDAPSARTVRLPCDVTWASPVDGDWEDATNWDNGTVPTANDVVCIVPGAYRVSVTSGSAMHVYLDDAALTVKGFVGPVGSPLGGGLVFGPSLDAGSLISDRGSIDVEPGARMHIDRLEMEVSTLFLDGLHTIETFIVDSTALVYPGNATVRGIRRLVLRGHVYSNPGARLSLHLSDSAGASATLRGALVDGTGGKVYIVGSPGTRPNVTWDGGQLSRGTVSDTAILTIQSASLALSDDRNSGDIELDPHGDTVALSGTIGVDASVHIRPSDPGATGSVDMQQLTNDGHLELEPSPGGVVTFTGALINRWTAVLGGRADLAIDSLTNTGWVTVTDSVRLTRGIWRNGSPTHIWGGNADLVVGRGAVFLGDPAPSSVIGTITLEPGGILAGSASVDRLVSLGGTLTPGKPNARTGVLYVDSLILDSDSRVVIDVAGLDSASQRDYVVATSRAELAGTLQVRTLPSFAAGACGQVLPALFQLNSQVTGTFDSLVQTIADPTRRWRMFQDDWAVWLMGYDPTALVSVSPPSTASSEGDFATFVTFCVAGTRDPTGDVTVHVASQSGQSSVATPLTLTPTDWAFPRLTWVRPVDDTVPEPTHIDSIQFSLTSVDAAFNGVSAQQLVHTITDNDPGADLTVAHAGGPTVLSVNQQFEGLFRVTNNSAVASSGATFTIVPMAGIDYVSNAQSVSCTPATGVLT